MNETETFQHYQVLRREDGSLWELGRGAMGVTYKAFDVNLRCEVALKVINGQPLDSEMARARFLREARAAAGLRHRNVASVYHLGNDADSFFYSMEFIDGQTVESLVQAQGSLSCADALQIVHQTARALGAAARQGLVHRDIKPANLMVVHEDEDEDEGFVVKVIDFGLARPALDGRQSGHITMGGFVGTPQYASPEQIEERDLDTRSDIYSLGITLWYMLVGQPPFTGSVFQISTKHLTAEPPWERLGVSPPEPVRALLAHMLQKDPANRPQTPAKLRAEIDECLRQLSFDPAAPHGHRGLASTLPVEKGPMPVIPPVEPASVAAELEPAAANVTLVQGPAPRTGTIFAGRYQLAERVADGGGGEVYRAYDGREDGRMVAVKVLRVGLGMSPEEFYHLQGDLGRLRFTPHPNLIDTHVLERIHGYKYCVMEWICGFTLQDLLRAQGPLPLRDALNLVGQASDAASHCSAHRFHRLKLASHQAMVHFPTLASDDGPPPAFAPILARLPSEWPTFQVKLDALDPTHEGLSASSGPLPRMASRDTHTSIRGLVESSYFHALGLLCYELLGGSAPGTADPGAITPLTALNEEGNELLRRALSTNPGFGNENEFFGALLATAGLRREEIGLPRALVEAIPASAKACPVTGTLVTPVPLSEPAQAREATPPKVALPGGEAPQAAVPEIIQDPPEIVEDHLPAEIIPQAVVEAKMVPPTAEQPLEPPPAAEHSAEPVIAPLTSSSVAEPMPSAPPAPVISRETEQAPTAQSAPLPEVRPMAAAPPVVAESAPVGERPPAKITVATRERAPVRASKVLPEIPPDATGAVSEPLPEQPVPAGLPASAELLRGMAHTAPPTRHPAKFAWLVLVAGIMVAGGLAWGLLKSWHPVVVAPSAHAAAHVSTPPPVPAPVPPVVTPADADSAPFTASTISVPATPSPAPIVVPAEAVPVLSVPATTPEPKELAIAQPAPTPEPRVAMLLPPVPEAGNPPPPTPNPEAKPTLKLAVKPIPKATLRSAKPTAPPRVVGDSGRPPVKRPLPARPTPATDSTPPGFMR